jgi:hypothetical protein
MVDFHRPGSSGRARSCPWLRDQADFRLMSLSKEELSKIRAKAGAQGARRSPRRSGRISPPSRSRVEIHYAEEAGADRHGRRRRTEKVTPKKRAHLSAAGANGGRVVTEKKRAHLRKALAAR